MATKKIPVASFRKGDSLTHAQTVEFHRLKGPDGKGKFKFAPAPKAPEAADKDEESDEG
jgi:hypothetical protein